MDFFDGEIDIDNDDELLRLRLGGLFGDETAYIFFSSTNAALFLFISSRIVLIGTGRKW